MILSYLKGEKQDSVKIGKRMLEDQLEVLGYKLNDKTVSMLMRGYDVYDSKPDELYFRIGIGKIKLGNLAEVLKKAREEKKGKSSIFNWFKKEKKEDYVISDGVDADHKYVIAACCNPIPGDSVIGFLAEEDTVTVHKRTCEVANSLASKFGDRIVIPVWEQAKKQNLSFLVRLSLKGFDRIGMINDITRYISFVMSVNIRKFCLGSEDGVFDGYIDLYVHDMGDLDKLIKRLQKIEGIQNVIRTDL